MCWPNGRERNERASLTLFLRFAFRSKVRCDYCCAALHRLYRFTRVPTS